VRRHRGIGARSPSGSDAVGDRLGDRRETAIAPHHVALVSRAQRSALASDPWHPTHVAPPTWPWKTRSRAHPARAWPRGDQQGACRSGASLGWMPSGGPPAAREPQPKYWAWGGGGAARPGHRSSARKTTARCVRARRPGCRGAPSGPTASPDGRCAPDPVLSPLRRSRRETHTARRLAVSERLEHHVIPLGERCPVPRPVECDDALAGRPPELISVVEQEVVKRPQWAGKIATGLASARTARPPSAVATVLRAKTSFCEWRRSSTRPP